MKKIGIVTWYGGSNYGTSLQAFALSFTLKQLGAKPYLLKKHMTWRNAVGFVLRGLKSKECVSASKGLRFDKKAKIADFRHKNFNQFNQCIGYIGKLLYNHQISTLSCIISGSDQLWNPYHTEPFLLLEGLDSVKFSYASSIGVKTIPNEKREMYSRALCQFKQIAVREESAIAPLEEITGKSIVKVLDPTFLLNYDQWQSVAHGKTINTFDASIPYILCYFIAENEYYSQRVIELQQSSGINRVVIIPMQPSHFSLGFELVEDAGINDFVYLINNASCICTDSFHATTISISLKRNFITLLRFKSDEKASQNSRIEDLLNRYYLMDRMYGDNNIKISVANIDYNKAHAKLLLDRIESMKYLQNIITAI